MARSSAELHEDPARPSETTIDRPRAIVSPMEQVEAVDRSDQRVAAPDDDSLAALLACD